MKIFDTLKQDLSNEEITIPESQTDNNNGLSSTEATRRLEKYGQNVLTSKKKINPFIIFISQYKDIMTIILLLCTLVSLFMGEYVEAIAIAIIILMNGILGFLQEYKTERTLEALKNMSGPIAKVYRDGQIITCPANELVKGDLISLTSGDLIPADCIINEATEIESDESMLTGESIPVKKSLNKSKKDKLIYMGCSITKGHCTATIVKTGMETEIGNIASMLDNIKEEPTPLQKKLDYLSKYIAIGCLAICTIVTITGIVNGEDFLQMLITGVSLAVAAVPEGLPAIVTISLALSVSRMIKRMALIRKLHAVETLGCATILCSDKTGTITQNKMTATVIATNTGLYDIKKAPHDNQTTELILKGSVLCNNAVLKSNIGSHTELALLKLGEQFNFTRESLQRDFNRISENPFDSTRKRMSVVCQDVSKDKYIFVKGGFDVLINKCNLFQNGDSTEELTLADKHKFTKQNEDMAENALRVIAIAYKKISNNSNDYDEDNLIYLGQIGLIDPPRREVKPAVIKCRKAGIKTVMITGDHKKTAIAIAKQVSIYHEGDKVLTGDELDKMSVEELTKIVNKVTVFARVNPNHKLQIVKALKKNGHIVAMTGDGTNDAPSIKEADIGVAMGKSGSDVSKEASSIILLDDNFASLVNAVEEGRSIYENIRKFIRYLLSCNIGEVLTMFLGMLMGMPVVLLPIQILFVNLVTDGLPAIALGLEPLDKTAMSRPPRKANENVFARGLASKIIFRGVFIGLSTLASFVSVYKLTGDVDTARSGALFALVLAQLIHVFECKSETQSIFEIKILNNKKLILATALSFCAMLLVLYVPTLQAIFSTVPLSIEQLTMPIVYSLAVPIANSILKAFHLT